MAQELKELGSKLENLPSSKDSLLKLLKQAAKCLSELDQSPPASVLESMQPFLDAVVKPELLKHQDKDVKLLVATCICEITRITAPEAPYSDDVLKDIFHLIVGTFGGLRDTAGPSFGRRVVILETLAKYRSCVVMLDLECYDLVKEMFRTFLDVASDDHPESVISSMQTIMVVLLEESEDIHDDILCHLLTKLGRHKNDTSNAARKLSMNVIEECAGKLEADIKKFLLSSMSGDSEPVKYQIDYHEVIYDIYRCAPQILTGVAPYLTGELLSDQLDTRLKAVRLVGDLFALPGSTISEAFQPIFSEFLKRLTDRVVTVRMLVLEHVKTCLLSNTSRPEAPEIISALCDRLLDFEEIVRKQVVAVICNVASHDLSSISLDTVKLVAERIRDKALLVKKYTMERLAEIYRVYCVKCSDGSMKLNEYDWIPGKILRCFFDKDFRSDAIESLIYGSLFPTEFTIKDKVQHWIRVFSGFDSIEVKALEKIMEQKQRLQQEMQRYLSLRQTYQLQDGDAPEVQKKVLFCFRLMSRSYADPAKAEENFQFLDQLKDVNVWKILTSLVDPNTSFHQACTFRDDLLKILGEKHRLYEFLSSLSMKISYLLFSKEHVKELLLEVSTQKSTGNSQYASSSMSILVILARSSPMLFSGSEEELLNFLKDGDETIKEGVLHVLAKAGGTIREQLSVSTSSIDLILEKVCLEGSRKQAKYAVHALAAITKDDGLKSLSVLYKKLVDMLDEKTHLPAVLQSLGCIAQTAMPVFETREAEIKEFIVDKILKSNDKEEGEQKESWSNRSELCLLKVYGIKTLVKSFLPVKDANIRPGVDRLLEILRNMLSLGEISKDIESSSVDKAHLRLASAKAILRLSKLWDHMIPLDIFHLTLRTSEISYPEAKRIFLSKVHQYIKDRVLDGKYACAFLLNVFGSTPSEFQEDKQNLADIIQMYQQTKARQVSIQNDVNSSAVYPEFIIPYLVHVLAHHSCPDVEECKDLEAYDVLYRQLYMIISMMVHKDEDSISEASNNIWKDTTLAVISIFHSIKQSEDVLGAAKSKSSHAICDMGLSIIKRLAPKEYEIQGSTEPASLPAILYTKSEKKEGDDSAVKETQAWLVDESSLAHFESLKLETAETLDAETAEEVKPGEPDGNDVPLGKVIKNIKSQGSKGKKSKRDNSSPVEEVDAENAVDVIQMVREINFDNLGQSPKLESSNGHDHSPSKKSKHDIEHQTIVNETANDDNSSVPVPKRKRSSSVYSASRLADTRADREKSGARNRLDFSVSRLQKKASASPKHKGKGAVRSRADKSNEVETSDDESPKAMKTDKNRTANESSTGSGKKRKRSLPGLVKCNNKDAEKDTEDLIGCRIKIWWPIDKRYYTGTVKSYDTSKMKHVVLYDDGDVEILSLKKEKWEVIDKNRKPVKKLTPSKPSPSKDISPVKAKSSGGSKQNKKPIKPVKRKRTPKKASIRGRKNGSKNNHREAEEKESSDLSDPEPTTTSKVDEEEINSGSSEGEQHDEKMDENVTDEQESDKEAKPMPKRKKLKGKEASPEPMELDEERLDSGEQLGKDSEDDLKSEEKKQQHSEDRVGESSEASEDETKEEEKRDSEADQADEEEHAKEEEENSGSEESQAEKATPEKSESEDDQGALSKDEEKSASEDEMQEAEDVSRSPAKPEKSENDSQNPSDVGEDEMSDDEPLMAWKNRVVKKGSKPVR